MRAVEYKVKRADGSVYVTRSYAEAHAEGNVVVETILTPIPED